MQINKTLSVEKKSQKRARVSSEDDDNEPPVSKYFLSTECVRKFMRLSKASSGATFTPNILYFLLANKLPII